MKTDRIPLTCNTPPVIKPLMIEFHASSFRLIRTKAQSTNENVPPQTPKFPPVTGALCLMADQPPFKRLLKP